MSSPESSTAPSQQHSSSTTSIQSKRKRRRQREPDRLGWLGGSASDQPNVAYAPVTSDDVTTKEWACSQCTLLHPMSERNCTVCKFARSSWNPIKTCSNTTSQKKRVQPQEDDSKQPRQFSRRFTKSASTELWITKHTPKQLSDLCIAPKKMEEVEHFFRSHRKSRQHRRTSDPSSPYEDTPPTQLLILVGSPGIGKSTFIYTLAKQMKLEVLQWNEDYTIPSKEYVPYQSQLSSFEEFLIGAGTGLDSLEERNDGGCYDGSVILIEEIPNLYTTESAQTFRTIMERHILRSMVPTVFIFSDVYEGKHKPEELERLIPSRILYSLYVQIVPIQPVTKAKMKKCIESIAKAEGLGRLSSNFMEELHLSSGGDLRHAIFALQFQYASNVSRFGSSNSETTTKRDVRLSSFHALGKLLYAKRRPNEEDSPPPSPSFVSSRIEKWDDGRGPLEFVPENVLAQTDMTTSSAISFLCYHCPDYFTDITELSHAFCHMSDAGSFLDRFSPADGPFPMDYASSIGGRAIADANKTPAPSQFRQLSAPKVFDVLKKNRENEVKMDQLRKRLSIGKQQITICGNIGSVHQFVTDSLPYVKAIVPQDVNDVLANLHSYAHESTTNLSQPDESDLVLAQQEDILKDDDLIDDDDNW